MLNDWPDLIMIDGGKGQLNSVMNTLKKLNLDKELRICSLAKKNEEIYIPDRSTCLDSEKDQPGVILLRRLRDEAHRFAIGFHRQQRVKRMTRSGLNEIPGIGPKRIQQLLLHFKSIQAIQIASLDQLSKTPGLGKEMALQVWKYFNNKSDSNS